MKPRRIGPQDFPIEANEEDELGLEDYVESLSTFIATCETPMTISLQGDWGSGKTSLMNCIKDLLSKEHSSTKVVWINTWQFYHFSMTDLLPIFVIRHFIGQLVEKESETFKKAVGILKKFSKIGLIIGSGVLGKGTTAEAVLEELNDNGDEIFDPAEYVRDLKEQMQVLVEKVLVEKAKAHERENHTGVAANEAKEKDPRVVVFIDDLDRLMPEKAVAVLECIKLFMDVKGCVYVLACDYEVIAQGVKKRFGWDSDDLNNRYFQKMMQVPFSMPTAQYEVRKYLAKSLEKTGIGRADPSGAPITHCVTLLESSTGFNPRSLKRIINQLWLLWDVASKRLKPNEHAAKVTRAERLQIIFAVLCMQMAYPALYKFFVSIARNDISDILFNQLSEPERIRQDAIFSELRLDLNLQSSAEDASLERMCQFVDNVFTTIQLESDSREHAVDSLSQTEINTFYEFLQMSSIMAIDDSRPKIYINERRENRRFARRLVAELNGRYSEFYEHLDFKNEQGFEFSQYKIAGNPLVQIHMTLSGSWGVRFEFSSITARMFIFAQKRKQQELTAWVDRKLKPAFEPENITINDDTIKKFVGNPS